MSTKEPEKIVLPSSPEAATYRTDIKGWVSRDGFFYGDGPGGERTARYAGSTHSECGECGAMCRKSYTRCDNCSSKAEAARWFARERREWDGVQMVYSDSQDRYYNSPSDALDSLEEGQTPEGLRLLLCEPQRPRELSDEDFADIMPDDDDGPLPKELQAAVDAYNEAIAKVAPLSWLAGEFALKLDEEDAEQ